MADFVAWACRTPRRLTLILGVPLLLVLIGGSLWTHRGGESTGNPQGSSAAASLNAQVPDAIPFVTAAVRFVNVWGQLAPGQTPDQWHEAVRALATPELANRLGQTDSNNLQGATATGKPQVRFVSAGSALIAVPMANGRSVLVTVVHGDSSLLVDDVEPDVGN